MSASDASISVGCCLSRDVTSASGIGQLYHPAETHMCVDNPEDVPRGRQKSTYITAPTIIANGNILTLFSVSFLFFFHFAWKQTASSVCSVPAASTLSFRHARKVIVVNANFVAGAICISKLWTFQSVIFKMSSGFALSLDYLLDFSLLARWTTDSPTSGNRSERFQMAY